MRYLWLTLLLLLSLSTTVFAKTVVPTTSIQPIQRVNDDGVNVNICTAFSINQQKGYWLTANHCFTDMDTFQGVPIQWVASNEKYDMAVFISIKRPALALATRAPEVGDEVHIVGFPYGALDPLTFFGRVASVFARLDASFSGMIYGLTALPGDSGAPILDTSDRVVGIGQNATSTGVVAWGVPWKVLVEQVQRFWE